MKCVCPVCVVCAHTNMLISVNWLILWAMPGYTTMVTGRFAILNFDFRRRLHSQLLTPKIGTGRQCALLCWRDGTKYQPRELSDPSLPFLTAKVCKLAQPVLFSVLTPHHACRALPHRSSSPSFFAARTAPSYSVFHASSCLLLQEPQGDTPRHHAPGADAWRTAVVCLPVDELSNTDKVSTWMLTLQSLGPCSHSQTLEATVLVKL